MKTQHEQSGEFAQIDRPRVAFTDGSIAGVVTARKRYPCGSHMADRHYIEAGQRYVANALPPDNPDICNSGWLHLRVCFDCCPVEHDPRQREVCEEETYSLDHYPSGQVDGYWIRCTLAGPHGKHEDSNTGLTWGDDDK